MELFLAIFRFPCAVGTLNVLFLFIRMNKH